MLGYTFQQLLSVNPERPRSVLHLVKLATGGGEGQISGVCLLGFLIPLHFHGKEIFL